MLERSDGELLNIGSTAAPIWFARAVKVFIAAAIVHMCVFTALASRRNGGQVSKGVISRVRFRME